MNRFVYIKLKHHGKESCDYSLYEDMHHKNPIGAGTFNKERGGLFAFAFPEIVHKHGLGRLVRVDPMAYAITDYQLTIEQR